MDKKIIGIGLDGTTIKFAILTADGVVWQKWSVETNVLEDGKHTVPSVIESIRHRIDLYNTKKEDFVRIGMGTLGNIGIEKGTVIGTYNLNWTTIQPIKEQIEFASGTPSALGNSTNVVASGECWKGAGGNNPDVIFATLETGAGGSIVAAEKLLHGVVGCAGEIKHVTVDPNGFDCTCGECGCLETVSSATGVVRVTRHLSEEFAGNSGLKQAIDNGQDISSKDVFEFTERGDHFALMVMDCVCFCLGLATRSLGNTLNPDSVVIGGGVSAAGEFLRSHVEKYFQEFTFPQVWNSTKIKLVELGNEIGAIGATSPILQFPKGE